MTTIRDVANQANVSVATVSRVLNQSNKVRPETRQHVEAVISAMGYQPNDIARTLFQGKSRMIALLVPDIMNPFFPELARAAEDVANQHGYTFVLCNTDDSAKKEHTYLSGLHQKSIDGLIIVSSTLTDSLLKDIKMPVIILDRKISGNTVSVTVNNRSGAKQAVQHLKDMGCSRIAHIKGPESASNALERSKGYLDMVQNESWYDPSYIKMGYYHTETAYSATVELLKQHPEIDGIFAANDLMALGVLRAASDLGISVPEKLAVMGFDGIDMGRSTMPTLSTMAQTIYKIGSQAAEMLFQAIQKPEPLSAPEPIEYDVTLIKRGSTDRRETYES